MSYQSCQNVHLLRHLANFVGMLLARQVKKGRTVCSRKTVGRHTVEEKGCVRLRGRHTVEGASPGRPEDETHATPSQRRFEKLQNSKYG